MSRRLWEQHLAGAPAKAAARPQPRGRTSAVATPRRRATPRLGVKLTPATLAVLDAAVPAVQVRNITLLGKPRMTRRDKWQKRPAVMRYRATCDEMRLSGLKLPSRFVVVAFLPMPASWSTRKKAALHGQPHQVKPDSDNVAKSVMDTLSPSDEHHWDSRCIKIWAHTGRCMIVKAPIDQAALEVLIAEHLPPAPR